jgi:hypothetical protein
MIQASSGIKVRSYLKNNQSKQEVLSSIPTAIKKKKQKKKTFKVEVKEKNKARQKDVSLNSTYDGLEMKCVIYISFRGCCSSSPVLMCRIVLFQIVGLPLP